MGLKFRTPNTFAGEQRHVHNLGDPTLSLSNGILFGWHRHHSPKTLGALVKELILGDEAISESHYLPGSLDWRGWASVPVKLLDGMTIGWPLDHVIFLFPYISIMHSCAFPSYHSFPIWKDNVLEHLQCGKKQCDKPAMAGTGLYMFIPPICGEIGDGSLLQTSLLFF